MITGGGFKMKISRNKLKRSVDKDAFAELMSDFDRVPREKVVKLYLRCVEALASWTEEGG